jgi:hypothetical protein
MSNTLTETKSARERREALFLELLPLVGGVTLLLFTVVAGLQPTDEHGRTWSWWAEEWAENELPQPLWLLYGYVSFGAMCVLVGIVLLFFFSGVGWIIAGHSVIGFALLLVRGYVSLGILAGAFGGTMRESTMYFTVSMAMAAGSLIALAFVTRPRLTLR